MLDGSDAEPLDLFTPFPESWKLARDPDFAGAAGSYSTAQTLHILV